MLFRSLVLDGDDDWGKLAETFVSAGAPVLEVTLRTPGALRAIAQAGRGVIVLLHRPESADELRRRALADSPPLQTKMDLRNYGIGAQILRDLNVGKMRLLAKPRKMPSMAGFDLEVTGYEEAPPARSAS